MSATRRNEKRRYRAGLAEKAGLGFLAFGVLQPVFGSANLPAWATALALAVSVGLFVPADYMLGQLEDEQ